MTNCNLHCCSLGGNPGICGQINTLCQQCSVASAKKVQLLFVSQVGMFRTLSARSRTPTCGKFTKFAMYKFYQVFVFLSTWERGYKVAAKVIKTTAYFGL